MTPIYFESHITIEPVFDTELEEVATISKRHKFKVAELLMKKRAYDTEERSKLDTFTTAKNKDYDKLFQLMNNCVKELKDNGYDVWRSKIEAVLFDERTK